MKKVDVISRMHHHLELVKSLLCSLPSSVKVCRVTRHPNVFVFTQYCLQFSVDYKEVLHVTNSNTVSTILFFFIIIVNERVKCYFLFPSNFVEYWTFKITWVPYFVSKIKTGSSMIFNTKAYKRFPWYL